MPLSSPKVVRSRSREGTSQIRDMRKSMPRIHATQYMYTCVWAKMNMILTNGSKYYPLRFQVTREIDTVLPQTKGSRLMLPKVLTDFLNT